MQIAESVLVVIVSTVLTIFLVVGIVTLIMIGRLVSAVKRIVDKAETIVESAEAAAAVLRNASGPLALFKIIRNIVKAVEKDRK